MMSLAKQRLKNLLLFLPLFFTSVSFGMSKNPSMLRYLAAAKVPKAQFDELPAELKKYAKNIQEIESSVKHAKRVAVISTYRSQLEELCKSAPDSRLFEEIYSSNPLLVGDLKTADQMLALCIQNGNTSIANFLFKQFPALKKDEVIRNNSNSELTPQFKAGDRVGSLKGRPDLLGRFKPMERLFSLKIELIEPIASLVGVLR